MKDIFQKTKAHAEILQFLHLGFKITVDFGGDYYVTTDSSLTWLNGECMLILGNKTNGHYNWKVLVHRRDGQGFGYSDSFIEQAIKPYILNQAITQYKGRKNLSHQKSSSFANQLCTDSHAYLDEHFYWIGDSLFMDVYNDSLNHTTVYVGRFRLFNLVGLYPMTVELSLTGFIHSSALVNRKVNRQPVTKKKGRIL